MVELSLPATRPLLRNKNASDTARGSTTAQAQEYRVNKPAQPDAMQSPREATQMEKGATGGVLT